jgi:transcriptional regulator with XRE-family HTH domain
MAIGDHLRQIRESKGLSQGDIEKKTGLIRAYISRAENGHSVPSIETLEKFAHALEVPLYALFYEGKHAQPLKLNSSKLEGWGSRGRDARTFSRLRRLLGRATPSDRTLLLHWPRRWPNVTHRAGKNDSLFLLLNL